MPNTLKQALDDAVVTLRDAPDPSPSAALDAQVLLAAALDCDRVYLIAHADDPLAPAVRDTFDGWVARRAHGEPVAHLLGRREFWSLDLEVSPATLIPRPDTETLVDAALEHWPEASPARVLDLGTGSGAIALALASERPCARITGIDNSAAALAVAKRNARRLELTQVTWQLGSWFEPLDAGARFDLIVSNPPYVHPDDEHLARGDVRFEPRSALVADDDGYADLFMLIDQARHYLAPQGVLALEHGADQGDRLVERFSATGYAQIRGLCDLAGQRRVTLGRHG